MFSASELAGLRKAQEESMMWECAIEAYSVDDAGNVSFSEAVVSVCGFVAADRERERSGSFYEAVEADAVLRLPLGVRIGARDRVRLLSAFGSPVEPPRVYEAAQLPDVFGPSGTVAKLKEIYI